MPVSHDPTRKQFLAKLFGAAAVAGAASQGLGKIAAASGPVSPAATGVRPKIRSRSSRRQPAAKARSNPPPTNSPRPGPCRNYFRSRSISCPCRLSSICACLGDRDRGRDLLHDAEVHQGGVRAGATRALQPRAPRGTVGHRLPLLPQQCRDLGLRQPSDLADLHELPQPGQAHQPPAGRGPRQLRQRPARAVDPNPQGARFRLFQPRRAHRPRRQLRGMPRPDRPDGCRHPRQAAQHGLLPAVPPRSRPPPAPARSGDEPGLARRRAPRPSSRWAKSLSTIGT